MKHKFYRIAAALLAVLLLAASGCVSVRWSRDEHGANATLSLWWNELPGDVTVGGKSVDAAGVERIRIDWVAGDIKIMPVTGNEIGISEEADGVLDSDEQLRFTVDKGELRIVFCRAGLKTLRTERKALTVTVPEALAASLTTLRFEVVSANVSVSGLSGRLLEMDSVSGGLQAEAGAFEQVDFTSVSGNAAFAFDRLPEKLEAETVSGSVTVALPDEDAGFAVELDAVSGKLNTAYAVTRTDDIYRYGDGACRIDFDTVSGDINIK